MQLNWRPMAMDDLDSVVDYIAQGTPRAAIEVGDAIVDQVGQLATHPNLGRPGRIEGTRETGNLKQQYIGMIGMLFHHGKFCLSEPRRFLQNFSGNGELANVMDVSCGLNFLAG